MSGTLAPLQIPMIPGGPELVVILLIAVLLFGANKIPKLARSTGQAMGEFQKGREEVEEELESMKEGELSTDTTSDSTTETTTETTTSDTTTDETDTAETESSS